MNDLDSGSDGDEQLNEPVAGPSAAAAMSDDDDDDDSANAPDANVADGDMLVPEGGVRPTLELDPEAVDVMQLGPGPGGVSEVGKVAKLAGGRALAEVLEVRLTIFDAVTAVGSADLPPRRAQGIEHYGANPDPHLATDSDSQEYHLIVRANNLSVEIDNEMLIVHKVRPARVCCRRRTDANSLDWTRSSSVITTRLAFPNSTHSCRHHYHSAASFSRSATGLSYALATIIWLDCSRPVQSWL